MDHFDQFHRLFDHFAHFFTCLHCFAHFYMDLRTFSLVCTLLHGFADFSMILTIFHHFAYFLTCLRRISHFYERSETNFASRRCLVSGYCNQNRPFFQWKVTKFQGFHQFMLFLLDFDHFAGFWLFCWLCEIVGLFWRLCDQLGWLFDCFHQLFDHFADFLTELTNFFRILLTLQVAFTFSHHREHSTDFMTNFMGFATNLSQFSTYLSQFWTKLTNFSTNFTEIFPNYRTFRIGTTKIPCWQPSVIKIYHGKNVTIKICDQKYMRDIDENISIL